MTIKRGYSAMIAIAFCRNPLRPPVSFRIGKWALGTSDRGGQDKSRKVRTVDLVRNSARFPICGAHCEYLQQCAFFHNAMSSLCFRNLTD
jgi:hypothetical protein